MNLKELYDIANVELDSFFTIEYPDLRLEQAEYNKEEKNWEIVVSYLVENTNKPSKALAPFMTEFPFKRIYKKLKINDNKEVIGLYIFDAHE